MVYEDPEAVVGEAATAKQVRIRKLYNEIQENNYGPDHRAQVLLGAKPVAESSVVPVLVGSTRLTQEALMQNAETE
eukprot:10313410-Karenia_brevis.AAC.1